MKWNNPNKEHEATKLTNKTEHELKLILKECEERFTSVYKEKNLSFEEQELVRSLFFEQVGTEQLAVCINRLKRFRTQKPTEEPTQTEEIILDETCGLCGIEKPSNELVKHIRFDPASELNYDYYYCPSCDSEIKEMGNLSYTELTKQIRQILKSYCKTLSIRMYQGWLKIGGSHSEYGELTDTEKDLLNSFGLNYGNGLEKTSIKGSSLAFWLIKIKRIHAKNTQKTPIAKGKISSEGSITIQTNEEKQGIEVRFSNKPDSKILTALKVFGFRWNNRDKLWYIKEAKLTPESEHFLKNLV